MNATTFWLVITIGLLLLVLASGVKQAESKTVKVCVSIQLPQPGKCRYFVHKGYRVRVCK